MINELLNGWVGQANWIFYRWIYYTSEETIHNTYIPNTKKMYSIIKLFSFMAIIYSFCIICCFRSNWWKNTIKISLFEFFFSFKISGGCGCKNFKNGFHCWRKIGFPWGSWYDEKIWSQKHSQTFGCLYQKWTYLYSDGIYALWWSENISFSKVPNNNIFLYIVSFSFG